MTETLAPLPLPRDRWRSRWLVVDNGADGKLHRVSAIVWEQEPVDDEGAPGSLISGEGAAVCGARGHFHMPGFFDRMGAPRCPTCCAALGIPPGDGAPFNALEGEEAER